MLVHTGCLIGRERSDRVGRSFKDLFTAKWKPASLVSNQGDSLTAVTHVYQYEINRSLRTMKEHWAI